MSKLSNRGNVEPFHAMDIFAEASRLQERGRKIDFLSVGQPAAPAPKAALEGARKLLDHGVVSYTDAGGRMDLRSRLSTHIADRYGVDVEPQRIFITTGSSAGFNLSFLSLFNPGDRVAIAAPGYPAYRNILKALSLEIVEIETDEETRWAITPAQLLAAHNDKPLAGILVASPANPTGTMMTPDALQSLIQCCDEMDIRFISDEIYHGLTYAYETGIKESTATEFSDKSIVINSFSKYFCMTGWRIGWMVLPIDMVRPVERLAQSLYISAPELSQVAAMHALDCGEELEVIKSGYVKNRKLLLERLPQLGFEKIMPIDGAFYAYADATRHTNDTMEFAKRMLVEAGVAATPGLDFDQDRGHRYMRFSFAGDYATMVSALDRMESWLA
ncbi:MAG: aminotransferase class I/II-fold pyridoxal phosphate-dependent enzyme [Rhizobiaceae bacterium]